MTPAPSRVVWLNGRLVAAEAARISIDDRGFLYGDGVFETVALASGVPLFLAAHLRRLARGLTTLRIGGVSGPLLRRAVTAVLASSPAEDAGVLRIAVSRGPGPWGPGIAAAGPPTVLVEARPVAHGAAPAALRLWPVETGERPLAAFKTANYLFAVLARAEAEARGFDDALLVNAAGDILETPVANVFVVERTGRLRTPARGCLRGVTAALVLELARAEGLRVVVGRLSRERLQAAAEVFCTNSLRGIVPVRAVGATPFAEGPVTASLASAYAARCAAEVAAGGTGQSGV